MKTRNSEHTREYNFGGGVSLMTLKGSWEHADPKHKPTATFFAAFTYHGISRKDAARTIREWRTISRTK